MWIPAAAVVVALVRPARRWEARGGLWSQRTRLGPSLRQCIGMRDSLATVFARAVSVERGCALDSDCRR